MNFKDDSKEDLSILIKSKAFQKLEISQVFANDLIAKSKEFQLFKEIEIVKFVTIRSSTDELIKLNHSQ